MSIRHTHQRASDVPGVLAAATPPPAAARVEAPSTSRVTLTVCGIPALALTWHTHPTGTGPADEVSTALARAGLGIAQWCCRHSRN